MFIVKMKKDGYTCFVKIVWGEQGHTIAEMHPPFDVTPITFRTFQLKALRSNKGEIAIEVREKLNQLLEDKKKANKFSTL